MYCNISFVMLITNIFGFIIKFSLVAKWHDHIWSIIKSVLFEVCKVCKCFSIWLQVFLIIYGRWTEPKWIYRVLSLLYLSSSIYLSSYSLNVKARQYTAFKSNSVVSCSYSFFLYFFFPWRCFWFLVHSKHYL